MMKNMLTKLSATALTLATLDAPVVANAATTPTHSQSQSTTSRTISKTGTATHAPTTAQQGTTAKAPTATNTSVTTPKPNTQEVTGKAPAGAKVAIKDAQGHVLGSTTANSQGTFTAKLNDKLDPQQKLQIAVKNDGVTRKLAPVVAATKQATTLSVDRVTSNSTRVTGRATAGAKVTVRTQSGRTLASGYATSNGTFSTKLTQKVSTGTKLDVTASHSGYTTAVQAMMVQ
ncbi:Ig-like domain-containing protein [Secundilactobacillus kimchicus]|uniref:Ig-like domain-containing protein n=1 Tax=Secundilactobacillus kimchicus TaxID=528209 RepID=UPI0024A94B2D|nr:Ig-like domain-containing protein [Secundilactobacillus kimchicus]